LKLESDDFVEIVIILLNQENIFIVKAKILVILNIEREDADFICKTINCKLISHIDSTPDKLGTAKLYEEVVLSEGSWFLEVQHKKLK